MTKRTHKNFAKLKNKYLIIIKNGHALLQFFKSKVKYLNIIKPKVFQSNVHFLLVKYQPNLQHYEFQLTAPS